MFKIPGKNLLNNKAVLITGGTGSLGIELTSIFLKNFNLRKIIIFSRDELKQSEHNKKFKQLENGLRTLSAQLQGIRLAILHGNPFAREAKCNPVMAIKQWFSLFSQRCKFPNRSESLLRRTNLNKVLL